MDQLLSLRVFTRIADAGTFVKAAESLKLPPSTVTKLIQDLESHLGVKLLHRTTRRVTVTPEGAAYYERAIRIISDVDDMDGFVANQRAQPKGPLRIDVPSILANTILLPSLHTFRARYPEIEIILGVSDRNVDLIGDGVDCVIRGNPLPLSSLIARRLAEIAQSIWKSATSFTAIRRRLLARRFRWCSLGEAKKLKSRVGRW